MAIKFLSRTSQMFTGDDRSYKLIITGGAIHNGGSCQISLSYDQGKSWTVIHSYIGECPVQTGESSYDFTVPTDAPPGDALFGWSWFNKVGNREMYMNCAVVTIGGGSGGGSKHNTNRTKRLASFDSRPDMFVANVGNGCGTAEGADLEFPNPGPDVTRKSQKTGPPTGSCAGSGAKSRNSDQVKVIRQPKEQVLG